MLEFCSRVIKQMAVPTGPCGLLDQAPDDVFLEHLKALLNDERLPSNTRKQIDHVMKDVLSPALVVDEYPR